MSKAPETNPAERLDYDVELPPLPHTLVETARLVGEEAPEDPISSLKSIVAADPVVAARTLRRVNSVYYGLKRQVGNVEQAIVLLGFEKVYQLILTNSLVKLEDLFSTDSQVRIFQDVISRCIATASVTHRLGQELYLPSAHLAYSAGLMHEIGRIILLYNRPAPYSALWWDGDRLVEPALSEESREFGAHYGELSAHAAALWELPETLALAIRFHVYPDRVGSDRVVRGLALAVRASRRLVDELILEDGEEDGKNDASDRHKRGTVGAYGSSSKGRRSPANGASTDEEDAPPALRQLADENEREPDELEQVVRQEADRIREFVRMSLSSSSTS